MSQAPRPITAIVGPTAAGKTAWAIQRAEAAGGEIISIDSRQIYRGFVIGTGQPSEAEQGRVRHHLINVLDPSEIVTAGRYIALVHQAMADIIGRGREPILCGGSGLYLRALRLGLSDVGTADPDLRQQVQAQIETEGAEAAWARLAEADPDTAAGIDPRNLQRLSRALEILAATGRPPSDTRQWPSDGAAQPVTIEGVGAVTFELVGLDWPREALYRRIDMRVVTMLAAGWLAEVEGLLASGVSPEAQPMQGVGYRELAAVVRGELVLEEALPQIQQRTRNFARRQITWFRKEPVQWVAAEV